MIAKDISPGDHRRLLFYDVLFADEGHQPQGDAGRSQVCDADDGVAVFPRMRALQSEGGKGKGEFVFCCCGSAVSTPSEECRVGWAKQAAEMSSLDMAAQHFARKKTLP